MNINQKDFANSVLIVLVVILAGALGYTTLVKKSALSPTPTISENTPQVSLKNNVISLENIGLTFELPAGYAVYQQEGFEGGYGTSVSIGKEIFPGHLKYAALQINIESFVYDQNTNQDYKPHEYIDIVFTDRKEQCCSPEYIKLFGNKAVQYTNDADGSISIVGYLRADQEPSLREEYLVRISSSTYGSSVDFNQELFDTVVNTLQVNK